MNEYFGTDCSVLLRFSLTLPICMWITQSVIQWKPCSHPFSLGKFHLAHCGHPIDSESLDSHFNWYKFAEINGMHVKWLGRLYDIWIWEVISLVSRWGELIQYKTLSNALYEHSHSVKDRPNHNLNLSMRWERSRNWYGNSYLKQILWSNL